MVLVERTGTERIQRVTEEADLQSRVALLALGSCAGHTLDLGQGHRLVPRLLHRVIEPVVALATPESIPVLIHETLIAVILGDRVVALDASEIRTGDTILARICRCEWVKVRDVLTNTGQRLSRRISMTEIAATDGRETFLALDDEATLTREIRERVGDQRVEVVVGRAGTGRSSSEGLETGGTTFKIFETILAPRVDALLAVDRGRGREYDGGVKWVKIPRIALTGHRVSVGGRDALVADGLGGRAAN